MLVLYSPNKKKGQAAAHEKEEIMMIRNSRMLGASSATPLFFAAWDRDRTHCL